MYAFKSFGSFILLHGMFFLIVMFTILWLFERGRSRAAISRMAVFAIAPYFLISFAVLGVLLAIRSSGLNAVFVTSSVIKLVLAFPILWLYFKVNVKLAMIYTILLLVASQLSPIFVRALLQLFEGKPGAVLFLLAAAALPLVLWIVARRIEDPESRMLARCVMIAVLIAPTLIVGHGGAAILPAGMVWPFLFQGGVDMVIQLVSLAISLCVTTVVLVVTYKAIAKAQSELQADKKQDP